MPRICCVVGCETGYKSNSAKVSTFSFPKNEDMQNKWKKAILRKDLIVSKNSAICAKHFTDEQLITKWTSGVGDKKVEINLKYPKLQNDAIPCLFSGPKYLSKPQKKRKSPSKRVYLPSQCRNSKNIKLKEVDPKFSETDTNMDELNQETIEVLQSSIIPSIEYFENMCRNIELTTLPDNWKYEINRGKKPSITFYTVKFNENEVGIFIEKQISFETDLILKCKLYDICFDIQDMYPKLKVLTLDELILVLNTFNTKKICKGGPLIQEFDGLTVDCADIVQNRWRHKNCTFLIDISSIKNKCIFCDKLRIEFWKKKIKNICQ